MRRAVVAALTAGLCSAGMTACSDDPSPDPPATSSSTTSTTTPTTPTSTSPTEPQPPRAPSPREGELAGRRQSLHPLLHRHSQLRLACQERRSDSCCLDEQLRTSARGSRKASIRSSRTADTSEAAFGLPNDSSSLPRSRDRTPIVVTTIHVSAIDGRKSSRVASVITPRGRSTTSSTLKERVLSGSCWTSTHDLAASARRRASSFGTLAARATISRVRRRSGLRLRVRN